MARHRARARAGSTNGRMSGTMQCMMQPSHTRELRHGESWATVSVVQYSLNDGLYAAKSEMSASTCSVMGWAWASSRRAPTWVSR